MNHNLETVKLKLRAYNTERGSIEDVFKELEDLEKEIRERVAILEKNNRQETTLYALYKEFLGGTNAED